MVIWLEQGANCLHMVQLMPLHPKTPSSLASFKSRPVLPFGTGFMQVVLKKRPLNGCSSSCLDISVFQQVTLKPAVTCTDVDQVDLAADGIPLV